MSGMTSSSASDHTRRCPRVETVTAYGQQLRVPDLGANHQTNTVQQQVKTLTNFSIDSIINDNSQQDRRDVLPSPKHQHQKHMPLIKSTTRVITSFDSTAKIKSEPYFKISDATRESNQSQIDIHKKSVHEARKYRPKNFQCPACGMAFSNNGQLKNHVRIHTGERPFRCNQSNCGKTFTRNEELTRHKLIHTGVRPHACPYCSKRFGRKDHLKKHVRTHDRKKLRKGCYLPPEEACSRLTEQGYSTDEVGNDKSLLLVSLTNERLDKRIDESNSAGLNKPSLVQMTNGLMQTTPSLPPGAQYSQYADSAPFLPPPPPVTFAPSPQYFDPSTARTMAAIASSTSLNMLTTTTSGPLQQLAGDYWQKWYDFLGFYQQP